MGHAQHSKQVQQQHPEVTQTQTTTTTVISTPPAIQHTDSRPAHPPPHTYRRQQVQILEQLGIGATRVREEGRNLDQHGHAARVLGDHGALLKVQLRESGGGDERKTMCKLERKYKRQDHVDSERDTRQHAG